MAQDLLPLLQNTIQSQVHRTDLDSLDVFNIWTRAGELIPPYWCKARDVELSRFWQRVDYVSAAFSMFISKFASIPVKVVSRDTSVKAWVREADNLTANINGMSDYGQGWANSFIPRFAMDYISTDNGAFGQAIGDAPYVYDPVSRRRYKDYSKPREGFYGLTWLDSHFCQRTSSPVYPVIYTDPTSGERYRLHYSRVMYAASMSSPRTRLNGVGFCALSRLINTAQHLWDISTAEQEELGSRPKRRLIIGEQGITSKEMSDAMASADTQMDNQGFRRYSKSVFIGSATKPTSANAIKVAIHDLNAAMRGEDKEKSITLAMFLIALALNIPPRWLWPASSTGATKADAMYQHIAGMGGGVGYLIILLKNLLGGDMLAPALGKPIGPQYEVVFDFQDDEQDRQAAEIKELRSKVWTANITSGIIDTRIARQQALDAGDLTEQQYDDLELGDGRLPDGTDVLNLFMTTDSELAAMLAISVGDVLNTEANEAETVIPAIEDKVIEVRAILVNPERPKTFDKAKQALAALMALKSLYEGAKVQQQIEDGQNEPQTASEQGATENSQPAEAEADQNKPVANPPVQTKEQAGMNIFDKFILMGMLNHQQKQAPPIIQVSPQIHLPVIQVPPIEIPAIELRPEINIPEQKPPVVNVTIPRQAAPVVNIAPAEIKPNIILPETQKEAPPVINFTPQINVPQQAAPVVNIAPSEVKVIMPEVTEEVTQVERDENGFIKLARKLRKYKK